MRRPFFIRSLQAAQMESGKLWRPGEKPQLQAKPPRLWRGGEHVRRWMFLKERKKRYMYLTQESSQKLPPRFSSVSMTTTQSSRTVCITIFIRFSGSATQPPV